MLEPARRSGMDRRAMPISSGWLQAAMLTYLFGFSVLGVLAYLVYQDQPPLLVA